MWTEGTVVGVPEEAGLGGRVSPRPGEGPFFSEDWQEGRKRASMGVDTVFCRLGVSA